MSLEIRVAQITQLPGLFIFYMSYSQYISRTASLLHMKIQLSSELSIFEGELVFR